MRVVDWLIGVIINPVQTLREIADREPLSLAVIVSLSVSFLSFMAYFMTYPQYGFEGIMLLISSLLASIFSLLILLISAVVFYIISKIFRGKKGSYWGLFSALAFSGFVQIFSPLNYFLQVFLGEGHPLPFILGLLLVIWGLVLTVISIRESLKISTGKSVMTIILSMVAVFIVVFLFLMIIFLLMGTVLGL